MPSPARTIACCLLVLFALVVTSCSDPAAPANETDRVTNLLTSNGGKWVLEQLTVSGVDETASNTGFTISFASSTYTTQQGGVVWAANGTWNFTDDTAKAFTREDGIVVSILSVNETNLDLSFVWNKTTFGSGRTASVPGTHLFKLKR